MPETVVDWWDPNMDIGSVEEAEAKARVASWVEPHLHTALAVTRYKRRLGAVDNDALAGDKKIARRVGGRLMRVLAVVDEVTYEWNGLVDQAWQNDSARASAAVVKWDTWLPVVAAECHEQKVWVATWVMRCSMGNSRGILLARELANTANGLGNILI